MRFTPRGEEIARVVDIMERDFDSGEAMAKAIISEVADMLHFREWFTVVTARGPEMWGPWASKADADAFRAKYLGVMVPSDPALSGVFQIRPVYGADRRDGGGFGYCHTEGCGHAPWAHAQAGASRAHCVVCGRDEGQSTWKCSKYLAEAKKGRKKK